MVAGVAIFEIEKVNASAAVVDATTAVIEPARLAIVGMVGLVLAVLVVLPFGTIRSRMSGVRRRTRAAGSGRRGR